MTRQHVQGLLLALLLACFSIWLSVATPLVSWAISPLIIGVLLGLVLGNLSGKTLHSQVQLGLNICTKQVLRLGVVLYGFRITVDGLMAVGGSGLVLSLVMTITTLLLGCYLGEKLLKIDRQTSFLTAIGSAICGAAAVLAAESMSRAKPHQAAAAVGTVVLFGTLAMLLYPVLFTTGILHLSDWQYGLYTGATVHEVAHVVAAGEAAGPTAGEAAVIVKMTRVLLLAPILILASLWFNRMQPDQSSQRAPIVIPWFVFGFMLCIGLNSLALFSEGTVWLIQQFDLLLLTVAMCALGLNTRLAALATLGMAPFYLGGLLFLWLMLSGWTITILFV